MMRKFISALLLIFVLSGLALAQEEESTPYEIALQRIEEARVNEYAQLYLAYLGLETLPPEIGNLNKLRELRLDNNNLRTLPPEIGQLESLTRLNVESNQLSVLPDEIGNLHQLESLNLGYNQLQSLSPTIGNLANLHVLTLENNLLDSLPEEISQLSNLCFLDISQNQIQYLPQGIGQLSNLNPSYYSPTGCPSLGLDLVAGFIVDGNPLISPPPEVIAQGTPAILDYLRNEALWHFQRLLLGGLSFIGIIAGAILGLRWKNRRGKKKR